MENIEPFKFLPGGDSCLVSLTLVTKPDKTSLSRRQQRTLPNMRWMTILILMMYSIAAIQAQQCLDEDGDTVDWYVMYKLPRDEDGSTDFEREGLAYMYITARTLDEKGWKMSSLSIGDPNSMPGRTLKPMIHSENMVQDLLWVLYNDQPPMKNATFGGNSPPLDPIITKYGHTKGAVLTDGETGFWLVHSVPHFLDVTFPEDGKKEAPHYVYPSTAEHYGQSFLCMTLGKEALEEVGRQLMYNEPLVYASSVPESLSRIFPELSSAAREIQVETSPWFRQVEIITVGGRKFISFAKAGSFGKELYSDWVATALQANLMVESWRNGPRKLDSQCNRPHWVENIAAINISGTSFKTTKDHSKWAVANEEEDDGAWACIGDINRMQSQEERGGGTVCTEDTLLWRAYRKSIKDVEACPKVHL